MPRLRRYGPVEPHGTDRHKGLEDRPEQTERQAKVGAHARGLRSQDLAFAVVQACTPFTLAVLAAVAYDETRAVEAPDIGN